MVCQINTHDSKDVAKVPNLIERCSVVGASDEWKSTSLSLGSVLDFSKWVGGLIRGSDAVGGQEIVGRVSLETPGGS